MWEIVVGGGESPIVAPRMIPGPPQAANLVRRWSPRYVYFSVNCVMSGSRALQIEDAADDLVIPIDL